MVKRRIIHLACVAPPQTGGIGAVADQEAALMRSRGMDAVVMAPQTRTPLASTAEVRRVATRWSFGNAAALRLDTVMSELSHADVVHLHYPFYGTAGSIAKLRKKGVIKRLVITLHMDAMASGWKGKIFDLHRAIAQRRILDAADVLLVSSKDYAEHSSFAPWKDRVIELPFGVDPDVFTVIPPMAIGGIQSQAMDSRLRENDKRATCSILHVGGMDTPHAFKGVDVLLDAMTRVPAGIRATLVGDGDLRASFEKRAAELGIADRVTFAGKIAASALVHAYQSADIFVFPSTSRAEAFGLAALEAQSCGVPVIASSWPGVRTVIDDGMTGFLVPPSDPAALAERITYLAAHPAERRQMGERARARVLTRLTWGVHADRLAEIYLNICASPS